MNQFDNYCFLFNRYLSVNLCVKIIFWLRLFFWHAYCYLLIKLKKYVMKDQGIKEKAIELMLNGKIEEYILLLKSLTIKTA